MPDPHLTGVVALLRIVAIALIAIVLWEAFETMVLPQRTGRRLRLTRFFYIATWGPWRFAGRAIRSPRTRETFLSLFGPLSALVLLAVWAVVLIFGFALIFWTMSDQFSPTNATFNFPEALYVSGSMLVTVGVTDVTATTIAARYLMICEAGIGFAFLAITITYLPVLYGAFSRREWNIAMLDARAGSPPTALELLRHFDQGGSWAGLEPFLADWERWAAEVLESHMSYPLLGFFRSQHHNQSWLGSLVTILDTCSWLLAAGPDVPARQARLTYAMCRHAVVDLSHVFHASPDLDYPRRLNAEAWNLLQAHTPDPFPDSRERIEALIAAYEPFVHPLARRVDHVIPSWIPEQNVNQNWAKSAWGTLSPEVLELVHTDSRFKGTG